MIKKRTVLAFLITVIVIIATNKYWLIFEPLPVSFDISGKGECNVEVILNKKDNNEFIRTRRANLNLNLNKISHADLHVNGVKSSKRVRFTISDLHDRSNITLSNIKIGKFNIYNVEKFDISGARPIIPPPPPGWRVDFKT